MRRLNGSRALAACSCVVLVLAGLRFAHAEAPPLRAGFSHADITPEVKPGGKPVWMAGYGHGRRAAGVHDKLFARAVVLESEKTKLALVAVDLVGLQYPAVVRIRKKLADFSYVLVASTHNHEGPDVVGIWGGHPLASGVDPAYLDLVIERVVTAVHGAEKELAPVTASFGTAEEPALLLDGRLPLVLDPVLRAIKLTHVESGKPAGLITVFSCHPESLGRVNKLITADFPASTVAALEDRYHCPVVYFSGTVGGLMSNPREWKEGDKTYTEGTWEFAAAYGRAVAGVFNKAIDSAAPIQLAPFAVSAKPIAVPLENNLYVAERALGVLKRDGREWQGDFEKLGPQDDPAAKGAQPAVETEVAALRLGELHLAAIPGELYPELLYGKFEEPSQAAADFPTAPLEPTVDKIFAGKKWLLVGLANDEIGYIIPQRQWDRLPPYAYGRKEAQYGEINSCGPSVAPIIMEALSRRTKELP